MVELPMSTTESMPLARRSVVEIFPAVIIEWPFLTRELMPFWPSDEIFPNVIAELPLVTFESMPNEETLPAVEETLPAVIVELPVVTFE